MNEDKFTRNVVIGIVCGVLFLIALYFGFRLISPQLNLYKANTEKQAQIAQSRSKAEAAKYEAEAEVARARGVAEANKIIAASIDENYLRYLYITEGLATGDDKTVVYVPTDGLLPITEAGRATQTDDSTP